MSLSRRALLGTTALIPAALVAACKAMSAPAIAAQIVADATGAVNMTVAVAAQINTVAPGKIPAKVSSALVIAQGLVANLSSATPVPVGAPMLQTVDTYLNEALQAIAAVLPAAAMAFPALAAAIPIIDGAIALLPVIEAYVNPLIQSLSPTAPVAAAPAPVHPILMAMTPDQARAALGIPTVH